MVSLEINCSKCSIVGVLEIQQLRWPASKGHVRLVKGFKANDTPESDVIRVGRRQLVSQTPPKLAQLKVEVILVRDLSWMLAQQDAKVVLF